VAFNPDLTDEQRANLATLAAYLLTLPADYLGFDMLDFASDDADFAHVPACGSVACAIGHGPKAGIEPFNGEDWFDYTDRAFVMHDGDGANDDPFQWCFGCSWHAVDNTPHGAAQRILCMLESGVPENSRAQRLGRAPLSYREQAA